MANHEFSFAMDVAKAFGEELPDGTITKMTIKGVASNTRPDLEDHQFTVQGLESIQKAIEDGIVDDDGDWSQIPLRSGHRGEWEDVLGWVTGAELDGNENLWITAELDPLSGKARELYMRVTKGNANGRKSKLGLSVKGKTTKYHFGFNPEVNKRVTFLDNLIVEEISVTGKPKNPTPYPLAIVKSLLADSEESMSDNTNVTQPDMVPHPATVAGQEAQAAAEAAQAARSDSQATPATDAHGEPANVDAAQSNESNVQDASQQEVATQPATAESVPHSDLLAQLSALTQLVQALQAEVNALKNQSTDVQKAQEDSSDTIVIEEPVATSVLPQTEDLENKIGIAVTKAFSDLGIADKIQSLQGVIDTLASQANDKSFSVSKAKDSEDDNDPIVLMNRLKEKGSDPLAAAFGALKSRDRNKS